MEIFTSGEYIEREVESMRIVKTTKLEEGMITALPVKTKHGQLIVNEGVALTDQLIARISFYGIDCIRIEEDEPNEEVLQEAPKEEPAPVKKGNVQEPTYSQRIKRSPLFQDFQLNYTQSTTDVRTEFFSFMENPDYIMGHDILERLIYPLMAKPQNSIEMFDMLHNMRSVNDSVYAHSINVALISGMFGKWLKFSKEDMDALLYAALLHDIGKARIPTEILDKPGKYTEEEFALVKMHPALGHAILSEHSDSIIDSRVRNAALMHHERCDGSGYPNGLKRDEIDDFAHIIAIADVYDAMTAARSHRAPMCPFHVIDAFEKEGLQKYHPKYILTFLEHIATTYQRNRVLLSNGAAANIIMLNKNSLSRPIVQLNDGECIDLSRTPEISIQSLL